MRAEDQCTLGEETGRLESEYALSRLGLSTGGNSPRPPLTTTSPCATSPSSECSTACASCCCLSRCRSRPCSWWTSLWWRRGCQRQRCEGHVARSQGLGDEVPAVCQGAPALSRPRGQGQTAAGDSRPRPCAASAASSLPTAPLACTKQALDQSIPRLTSTEHGSAHQHCLAKNSWEWWLMMKPTMAVARGI